MDEYSASGSVEGGVFGRSGPLSEEHEDEERSLTSGRRPLSDEILVVSVCKLRVLL